MMGFFKTLGNAYKKQEQKDYGSELKRLKEEKRLLIQKAEISKLKQSIAKSRPAGLGERILGGLAGIGEASNNYYGYGSKPKTSKKKMSRKKGKKHSKKKKHSSGKSITIRLG